MCVSETQSERPRGTDKWGNPNTGEEGQTEGGKQAGTHIAWGEGVGMGLGLSVCSSVDLSLPPFQDLQTAVSPWTLGYPPPPLAVPSAPARGC